MLRGSGRARKTTMFWRDTRVTRSVVTKRCAPSGVDYGTLLELMAERGLAIPRVPDEEAEAMARTLARIWRGAREG